MSEPNRILGMRFLTQQDRLRGGPDPDLCAAGYTAQINGHRLDFEGHRQMAAAFYGAFPDLNQVIEDTVADDDKVAVSFVASGTHQADLMGIPPTGKRFSVHGIAIFTVKDGKIAELREVFDQAGMMEQLGVAT